MKIKRGTVSSRPWGDVDKSALRNRLVRALEEGQEGAAEAIREVYAVIRGGSLDDAPSQNWWGPHHEVTEDGSVVLNRNGVQDAVGALAGARAEPDLTAEQKRKAARHLMRHYRELEMEPPDSLKELAGSGEVMCLYAPLSGEMRVEDVPLAPGVDLAALKAGDDDPLEVVVEVPAGKSKRGWRYTEQAIRRIVDVVMGRTLNGFLGHQRPEDVPNQFLPPATHWVGALWQNGKGYFRGVVDKTAADLKRWIRARRVKQVSIFGMPKLATANGETVVTDYEPLSIDWTPLDRAGMDTRVVAMSGEMWDALGEAYTPNNQGGEMTVKELLAKLRVAGEIDAEGY